MKKEFLLGLIALACLPGCRDDNDTCCDASTPGQHGSAGDAGVAGEPGSHDEGMVGSYVDYRDTGTHVGVENAEVIPGEVDMNKLFDDELKKWEQELEEFAKVSEFDSFEAQNWREAELGAPVFMASVDESMDKVEVQEAVERTVIQWENAKKEGTTLSVLCQEYAWTDISQEVAEELAQELIAAGIPAEYIKVATGVAAYDPAMPPHRVEVSMQTV